MNRRLRSKQNHADGEGRLASLLFHFTDRHAAIMNQPTQSETEPELFWVDSENRKWHTYLDVPNARRIRQAGYDFINHDQFSETLLDPYRVLDFVTCFHEPSWRGALQITEEDFLGLIVDKPGRLEQVIGAVVRGLVDFFRRHRDELRARVMEKAWTAAQDGQAEIAEKLNSEICDQALKVQIAKATNKLDEVFEEMISGDSLTSSPESLGPHS